jgi:hypothetical protein
MAGGRKIAAWGGGVAAGLILLGLGIYLLQLGLAKAALVTTILGGVCGLVAVGVAVVTLIMTRSGSSTGPRVREGDTTIRAGTIIYKPRKVFERRRDRSP